MKTEVEVAAKWWADRLDGLPHESMVTEFEASLRAELTARYEGHWYADEPTRGGGYRSVVFDQRQVDSLLEDAGRRAGIMQLRRYLRAAEDNVMFVNPGAVRVRSLAYFNAPTQTLYEAAEAGAPAQQPAGEGQEAADEAPATPTAAPAASGKAVPPSSVGPRSPVYANDKARVGVRGGAEGLSVGA